MSMVAQGMSWLNWVWRWAIGFCRAFSPAIQFLAGEKVCIQVITPAQFGAALAARHTSWISSGVVSTGL